MKKVFIMTAICLLLLPCGCRKTGTRKTPDVPVATEPATQHGESQSPYYSGLIDEYRRILAEDPNNLAALTALGNAYFDNGQWKEAITIYEHALLINPGDADVRTDLGTAYRNIGMADRALAEYRIALKHDPGHLNARYNTGVVYATNKKNYKEAIRIWEGLLKIAPNYPQAEQMRSIIMTFNKAPKKDVR
jgi:tetratricopeptide (TPR) repeat protein